MLQQPRPQLHVSSNDMAEEKMQAQPDDVKDVHDTGTMDSAISNWSTPTYAAHPMAADIIRQVEYYLGDDNIRQDAHLLGLMGGDPNGPVSIKAIMGFRKMRSYKPMTAVREALRESEQLDITRDERHVKRKYPYLGPLLVKPQVDEARQKKVELAAVGLTKKMLEPTGFEPDAVDNAITQEEHESKYAFELGVPTRLENAINSFQVRRKMHQDTSRIFASFVIFGGMEVNSRAFQGGNTRDELKKRGLSKAEIEGMSAHYSLAECVRESVYAEADGNDEQVLWAVNFEKLAKAWLSSEFIQCFDWGDLAQSKTATQVLRSFYQYLVYHDVFPEYKEDIEAALAVCDLAEAELPKLSIVGKALPGDFNVACSTLFRGRYENIHRSAASAKEDDPDSGWTGVGENIGLTKEQAENIFKLGIAAYGTDEQYQTTLSALQHGGPGLEAVSEEKLGLEMVRTELPTEGAKTLYDEVKYRYLDGGEPYILPMGKLICKRWDMPFEPPSDLPENIIQQKEAAAATNQEFAFLLEESTLQKCEPGMKIEATVKELGLGIKWIDSVDAVYPTFFTFLLNDRVRAWKEPGPPKSWMERQNAKKAMKGMEVVEDKDGKPQDELREDEGGFSDEEPE